jgi:vancomycin aglycone glucosyltransferase
MHALLSTYGSRGDVEPMVGLAVQMGALGTQVRVPPAGDLPLLAADACDAPVATGVTPTGGR